MRQYLAIIKDSFRAAMASRVLYVLLALITLLLVALAPFHFVETLDWKLVYQQHVKDTAALVEQILEEKDNDRRPEIGRIWELLPASLKKDLEATGSKGAAGSSGISNTSAKRLKSNRAFFTHQKLIEQLNELIKDPEFYRPEDWKRMRLSGETKALKEKLEQGYSSRHARRLNRLLIGRAFRSSISRGQATSMSARYGPWAFEMLDVPTSQAQFGAQVISVIPGILDKFVLSIGLAVALLFTASIIPETFEPGSLNLLLSKPISRSGLFLSKFVGGCVFIALCATYLFLGIWLWLGLAMGVWENAILYCIVLYVIVFGIYYSVSAFVGLTTRSTILSVVVTILFWGTCFLVGTGHGILNTRMQNTRIVGINSSNEETVQLNRLGQFSTWDGENHPWHSLMPNIDNQAKSTLTTFSYGANFDQSPDIVLPYGPVINPADGQVITGNTSIFNPTSFSRQPMLLARSVGERLEKIGKFPTGMTDLLQGKTIAVALTSDGKIYRFQDPVTADDRATDAGKERLRRKRYYVEVSPDEKVAIEARGLAAINAQSDDIAIYRQGKLHVLKFNGQKYTNQIDNDLELGVDKSMSCLIEFQGNKIVLAFGNGDVILIDSTTLKETARFRPASNYAIDAIAATADGQLFFLVTGNQRLWMLDAETHKVSSVSVAGQGEISAVSVDKKSDGFELTVADRTNRLTRYRLPSLETIDTKTPPENIIEKIYRLVVRPLYWLWPKPGEFYKVVTYLSSTGNSDTNRAVDLRQQPKYQNPFSPLTSGLAFMAVMLLISCVYFTRKDY